MLWPVVGRPAWCLIHGEKKVSTLSSFLETDPSTEELPFEQCSGDNCASVDKETLSEGNVDDKKDTEEPTDNNIIEADSSEEVARAIAASVLR